MNARTISCDVADAETTLSTIFEDYRGVVPFKKRMVPQSLRVNKEREIHFDHAAEDDDVGDWKSVVCHIMDDFLFDRIDERYSKHHKKSYFDILPPKALPFRRKVYRLGDTTDFVPKLITSPTPPAQAFINLEYLQIGQSLPVFSGSKRTYNTDTPSSKSSTIALRYQTPFADKSALEQLARSGPLFVNLGMQINISPLVRSIVH
jgi:hypothetical protein